MKRWGGGKQWGGWGTRRWGDGRYAAVRCRGIGPVLGPPVLGQCAITVCSPSCRAEAEAARSSTVGDSATKAAVMNR